ncbi:MAG: hypothetical protein Kow00127_09320 [Bacteroidales bacterium]
MWSLAPNGNFATWPYVKANAWTWDGDFGIERTYIRFDLSDISPDADILEAKLSLFYHYLPGNPEQTHQGDNQAVLMRVTGPWTEYGLTWNNQPGSSSAGMVVIPVSSGPQSDYLDIDVTEMVTDMVANPDENFGFLFKLVTEEIYRRIGLSSSDHPDPSKWPLLTITFDCEMPVAGFTFVDTGNGVYFYDNSTCATSWNWDFGDGYGSTLQNPVHTYLNSGVYEVCLTVSNVCGSDTKCDIVRPSFITGISHYMQPLKEMELFPVPADNQLFVKFESILPAPIKYQIMDINGKTQLLGELRSVDCSENIHIDVSSLSAGLYFLTVSSTNKIFREKIVIR